MSKSPRSKLKTKSKPVAEAKAKTLTAAKVKTTVKKTSEVKVSGKMPIAVVHRSLAGLTKLRRGRGFSRRELRAAGLDTAAARRLGLQVDFRRDTEWSENVDALKGWLAPVKKAVKSVKKVKAGAGRKRRTASKTTS